LPFVVDTIVVVLIHLNDTGLSPVAGQNRRSYRGEVDSTNVRESHHHHHDAEHSDSLDWTAVSPTTREPELVWHWPRFAIGSVWNAWHTYSWRRVRFIRYGNCCTAEAAAATTTVAIAATATASTFNCACARDKALFVVEPRRV